MPVASLPLTIALAGCGTVGSALVQLLRAVPPRAGRPVRFSRVLVKRSGQVRPFYPRAVTLDLEEFLASRAELTVEVTSGIEPALTIARRVLGRGGRFITANKALVARHGAELDLLARSAGGWFGFEAAVGGGIPVVRTLRETLRGLPVRRIEGILNGTSNFLLSRLEDGVSTPRALAEARTRGLAEADISRDLNGCDIADKLTILAWVAWGVNPAGVRVVREPLPDDPAPLVREAEASGTRVRFLGEVAWREGVACGQVRPVYVPARSAFGQTRLEENRVEIDLGWQAPLVLGGPGAGGAPTASALWSDIQAAAALG